MPKHSQNAEESFKSAARDFLQADKFIAQNHPTDLPTSLFMGLVNLCLGLGELSQSIRDLGDMLSRVERGMANIGTKRGPTGA